MAVSFAPSNARHIAGTWKILIIGAGFVPVFSSQHSGGLLGVRVLGFLVNMLIWVCKLCH